MPANRLLKYRSSITYNGDIVVMDTVPFPEVQEIWIAKKSPSRRDPAQDPFRITSHKVVDEVVVQCEYATMAAPPPVIQALMDTHSLTKQQRSEEMTSSMNWEPHGKHIPRTQATADVLGCLPVVTRITCWGAGIPMYIYIYITTFVSHCYYCWWKKSG